MKKAKRDYINGKHAKEYKEINIQPKQVRVWCADNIINEYYKEQERRRNYDKHKFI